MAIKTHNNCSRCSGMLVKMEYLTCIRCGFTDYNQPTKIPIVRRPEIMRGNVSFANYSGTSSTLAGKTVKVEICKKDVHEGLKEIKPECPFCFSTMSTINATGIKRDCGFRCNGEKHNRFQCRLKHAVWLQTNNREFTWH